MAARATGCDRQQRQRTIACFKFNGHPESGISYLREHGLLSDSGAAGVAEFLHTTDGLSKSVVGRFFGDPASFNQEVLAAFVRRHNFGGQKLLPSLRRLLGGFLLPSESQQITRVVNCFAQHYCLENSTEFASMDACVVLCNALLLLNTLLHNPKVHDRPNVKRLAEMAQHDGRPVLPRSQLQDLYYEIKWYPFEVPIEDGDSDLALALRHPECSGWLTERRWMTGRCLPCPWRRLWFVMLNNNLCYFSQKGDTSPLGIVPLVNLRMRVVQDFCKKRKFCFELYGASGPVLASEKKTEPLRMDSWRLSAENHQNMTEWMLAINAKTAEQPPPSPLPQSDRR